MPNHINIKSELKYYNWKAKKVAIHPLEHVNCFTQKTLIYITEKAGLKPIDASDMSTSLYCIENYFLEEK